MCTMSLYSSSEYLFTVCQPKALYARTISSAPSLFTATESLSSSNCSSFCPIAPSFAAEQLFCKA